MLPLIAINRGHKKCFRNGNGGDCTVERHSNGGAFCGSTSSGSYANGCGCYSYDNAYFSAPNFSVSMYSCSYDYGSGPTSYESVNVSHPGTTSYGFGSFVYGMPTSHIPNGNVPANAKPPENRKVGTAEITVAQPNFDNYHWVDMDFWLDAQNPKPGTPNTPTPLSVSFYAIFSSPSENKPSNWNIDNTLDILKKLANGNKGILGLVGLLTDMCDPKGKPGDKKIFAVDSLDARYKVGNEWKNVPIYQGYSKAGNIYIQKEGSDLGAALLLVHEGIHAMGGGEEKAYSAQVDLLIEALKNSEFKEEAEKLAKWFLENGMLEMIEIDSVPTYRRNPSGIKKFLETSPDYNVPKDNILWDLEPNGMRRIYPQRPQAVRILPRQ